ncbi:MAG: SpoIIE family protein phosphatase [Corynebacteriales bacterium]|nr:SpoIIE family protein phosphatase [Mycobacteriales bacterium]
MDIPPEEGRPDPQVSDLEVALARAVLEQGSIGVVFLDAALRVTRSHIASERFHGLTVTPGMRLEDLVPPEDAEGLTTRLRQVLATGKPLLTRPQRIRIPPPFEAMVFLTLSALRLHGSPGQSAGLSVVFHDVTEEQRAQRRLNIVFEAAATIGDSLDVTTTAQELADVLIPALGDTANVDLAVEVFAGDEPPQRTGGGDLRLRRAAVAFADGIRPEGYLRPGDDIPLIPNTPEVNTYQRGETLLIPTREVVETILGNDPDLIRAIIPKNSHTAIISPLRARGLVLGALTVWRGDNSAPFDEEDLRLVEEVTSRAALSLDNARRYTRERAMAVGLQRSLLPAPATESTAARTAGVYLPPGWHAGVGGDWYDVIGLSSLRVAFVVGDVVGHGLHATAAMGRLRTAVRTLADDLSPDELLAHLDDLMSQDSDASYEDSMAGTCLYAVYDPISGRCAIASAGHPPPVVVYPDGSTEYVELSPGPPLGVGGLPFEVSEIVLPRDSFLVFYTDGLIDHNNHDLGVGMENLRASLVGLPRADATPPGQEVDLQVAARDLVTTIVPDALTDDVTLLLTQVRTISDKNVARWEIPPNPVAVANARKLTGETLAGWGLEQVAFVTELVVSELVTNAIRYAGGPITLRLIHDGNTLICEVTDPSNTQPRMRRARTNDEGGRGLFLVAQMASRWGSRYGQVGKTIWAEQHMDNRDSA